MRVHKENTYEYESFLSAIEAKENNGMRRRPFSPSVPERNYSETHVVEKYAHMFQSLSNYVAELGRVSRNREIVEKFNSAIKRILPVKDSALLNFNETGTALEPVTENSSKEISKVMNHFYREGILTYLFDKVDPLLIPELSSYNSEGSKLNYIIFPLAEQGKKKGIFVILSSVTQNNFSRYDKQIIKLLLDLSLSKIEQNLLKEKINSTVEDLQVYQAKLSNDFRLAAIGELTEGIVEDIVSPLQNILTNVDMIENEETPELKNIKTQVSRINSVVNRLVKFAGINKKDVQIAPCNINKIIEEYYTLVKSTLESLKLECVLDFENEIPSILSHSNYIFQLMTNLIGMIKNKSKESGGIIIQTRYKDDKILLKIVSTTSLDAYAQSLNARKISDLNLRIIHNLMRKHEGKVTIESFEQTGSTITLEFPLKRKVRK